MEAQRAHRAKVARVGNNRNTRADGQRGRSAETLWCDGVVSLTEKLRGSPKQVAEALLAAVFVRARREAT